MFQAAKDESRKQDDILSKQGLQAIFNEMAVCPPPLSAIETPRISDHEGNNSKNLAPKYSFMSIVAPLTPIASTPSHEDIPTNTSTIGQTNHFKGKYYLNGIQRNVRVQILHLIQIVST